MIDRVKGAVRSYEVMRHNFEWRVVRLSGFGDIRFRSKVFDEAQARCDELNARAVIEAMREPSEAMKRDGAWTLWHHTNSKASATTIIGEIFVSMIDAALTEPEAP